MCRFAAQGVLCLHASFACLLVLHRLPCASLASAKLSAKLSWVHKARAQLGHFCMTPQPRLGKNGVIHPGLIYTI